MTAAARRLPANLRAPLTAVMITPAILLAACGADGADGADGTDSPSPGCTPAPEVAPTWGGTAAGFDLTGVATPLRVTESDNFIVINAQAEGDLSDLATSFIEVVQDAGFDIAGTDDEGFEAEVFFANGTIGAGQVVLTESDCAGFVDIKISVLDDPAVLPTQSGAPPTPTTT